MARNSQPSEVDQSVTEPTDIAKATPFQRLLREMALTASLDAEENRFSGDDLNALLEAETVEEIWEADERGPINFQHLAGCDIAIRDFSVKYSRGNSDITTPFQILGNDGEKRKMYLIVNVIRTSKEQDEKLIKLPDVGEEFQVNTSARYVVGKIWAFYKKGLIEPSAGKMLHCYVKSTDLGGSQAVIKLRPPRNQSVQSSVA